jgi:hypothetical protein
MFLNLFKKGVSYIKDLHEMALFAIMSNEEFFFIFNGTPLYFVMLPMIGLLFTAQLMMKGYELSKANNKNLDQWLGFIVSALSASLASISLYGSVVATYLGLNFVLGPWFFLASIGVALVHQLTMIGLNLYRAYESLSGSSQRMHYVQASLNNVFHVTLISAVAGAVIFVMLTPIAPMIGSVCALTAVALTGVNILWKILTPQWRRAIKNHLELEPESELEQTSDLIRSKKLTLEPEHHYKRMFTTWDHSAAIKSKNYDEGLTYLQKIIKQKIDLFNSNPLSHSEKNKQKNALLIRLSNLLNSNSDSSLFKEHLLKDYPLAFQSFWAEKGEVEQIVDAAKLLKEKQTQVPEELQEVVYDLCNGT